MSTDVLTTSPRLCASSTRLFALATLAVMLLSWGLAGWLPVGFSILTVFLFAGPHNWMEARFFLERMPPRWGQLKSYFLIGLTGVPVLCLLYASLPWLARGLDWDREVWLIAVASWNTLFVGWILVLVQLRSRQKPERDWRWVWSAGAGLLGLIWLWPQEWGLVLVYLHPLVALWFLDRELKKHNHAWRRSYHLLLGVAACLVGILWWRLAAAPPLPGEDGLTLRITQHAGSHILEGISSHCLVATHTFLEMLHYSVWLVALPLVSLRAAPWDLRSIALSRRSRGWRGLVLGILCLGLLAILGFWAGFLADYPLTRDIYFTVAMLHVLAEVPFLLRTL